ncbi:hypothetical protein N7457_001451 [Penicillium paradoxum]|uniref:uncharacterized protein n=1 Tax=Penicillium paradoxum TaxID=176176 RepID=UPI002549510F|nr:uncharacterized protein N7457_001451 [Penicillium paradoxum]KAJ5794852.1 hypothetical protein N7457_001451 [Penicillium paradoxum]
MDSSPTQRLNTRRLPRATTFEGYQRRNSTLSDSLSEARNSIRSSTDGLFLPRVAKGRDALSTEESHWHSAPLGLALLPAIAGIFFHEGSAFVTDVTLLVLAAIFLNWSVRLPWDWYRSAQAIRQEESGFPAPDDPTPFEPDEDEAESPTTTQPHRNSATASARSELQIHELAALAACFIFPVIGTWLLHAIRSSLSRPSEGLVSNYNLTIFLLASEVRPVAHLLRLIQKRTLHLQRIVASSEPFVNPTTIQDLTKRLEELEAHVAETASARSAESHDGRPLSPKEQPETPSLVAQSVLETRKSIQPDIEALNRAVRRYEKRSAVFTLQTDQRFAHLETQAGDAIALAAAAQRSSASRRPNYALVLLDWACACIVIPAQLALSAASLPGRAVLGCWDAARRMLTGRKAAPRSKTKSGLKGKAGAPGTGSSAVYRQGGLAPQRRSVRNGDGM